MELRDFGNGSVTFLRGIPEQPATTTTKGNITINNVAVPGTPGHYLVQHFISFIDSADGVSTSNSFQLETTYLSDDPYLPYRDVEDACARKLPTLLRELAAALEQSIAETDQHDASQDDQLPAD